MQAKEPRAIYLAPERKPDLDLAIEAVESVMRDASTDAKLLAGTNLYAAQLISAGLASVSGAINGLAMAIEQAAEKR